MVRNPFASAGDAGHVGLILGLGRSCEGRNGSLFQYSCLENPMTQDPGRLQPWGRKESNATEHTHMHLLSALLYTGHSVKQRELWSFIFQIEDFYLSFEKLISFI